MKWVICRKNTKFTSTKIYSKSSMAKSFCKGDSMLSFCIFLSIYWFISLLEFWKIETFDVYNSWKNLFVNQISKCWLNYKILLFAYGFTWSQRALHRVSCAIRMFNKIRKVKIFWQHKNCSRYINPSIQWNWHDCMHLHRPWDRKKVHSERNRLHYRPRYHPHFSSRPVLQGSTKTWQSKQIC